MTLEDIDRLLAQTGPRLGGPLPHAKPFPGQPISSGGPRRTFDDIAEALSGPPSYQSPFGDFTDTGVGATDDALEPAAPAPHEVPTGPQADIVIRDHRKYIPPRQPVTPKQPSPSSEGTEFTPPERAARRKAEGATVKRMALELQKLKRERAIRGGQADASMLIPPKKFSMSRYPGLQRSKRGYLVQPVGN